MNDWENISEQLSAYLDGELHEDQARRVEQALREDPSLAREFEALKAARELVRSLPSPKAPEDFASSVIDKAERMRLIAPTPIAGKWSVSWASLATAAVVLIAVGIGLVMTITGTLTPSWSEKVARKHGIEVEKVAVAPIKEDEEAGKAAGEESARERKRRPSDKAGVSRSRKPDASILARGKVLDVAQGEGEISPGLAAQAEQPGDQVGVTNVAQGDFGLKAGTIGRVGADEGSSPAVAPTKPIWRDEDAMVPATAAEAGPRAERAPGVVTQAGEPLYRGRERDERTSKLEAEGIEGGQAQRSEPLETPQPAISRGVVGRVLRPLIELARVLSAPTSAPTSQPASVPTSQPTSQPASPS